MASSDLPGGRPPRVVLGIWDGHDSGAAVLVNGRIAAAANEERFTRRKLEIAFPRRAIESCLAVAGVRPEEVDLVAASTADIAKTLGRYAPWTKEKYYRVRRRLDDRGALTPVTRALKYRLTEFGASGLTRALSAYALRRELAPLALARADLRLYDHHHCHAVAAAFCSQFPSCAVVTVDGVGDGLSSTISRFDGARLTRIAATSAAHSIGVFFEHVTSLLNMRELEDEGKVMALADHAAAVADEANPMLSMLQVSGLQVRLAPRGAALRRALQRVLWRFPSEQFAGMAQRAVEGAIVELARSACRATGERRLALAGGVASNVKANRRVRLLEEIDDVYVFPHMGDGGLAIGAAVAAWTDRRDGRAAGESIELPSLFLGPSFDEAAMARALNRAGVPYSRPRHPSEYVADLVASDRVVMWFQGAMEIGPRALGGRSVLARPDQPAISRRLNLALKRRVWYQPFCPSMLESDAVRVFDDWKGAPDRHMTMTYHVRSEAQALLAGVTSVDDTCRPQIVADDDSSEFAAAIRAVGRRLGMAAVLNTSFNIHGEPIVCTPEEAVDTFTRSGADALQLGPFLALRGALPDR